MQNNKAQITILFLIVIIGIVSLFFFVDWQNILRNLALIPDIETQLKQEYITYWADETDGIIKPVCPSTNCRVSGTDYYYEDDKFITQGSVYAYTNKDWILVETSRGNPTVNLIVKQKFKGQEVALLLSNSVGNCVVSPAGSFKSIGESVIKYIPHTFDTSIYDVYQDGVKIKEINIGDGFNIKVSCSGNYQQDSIGDIGFIGYKAEYACDLSSDEVWVQENFAQPFNINDLSFPPTKFCDNERPFILRNIEQGETKIRLQEGIIPLNKGEIIPPRDMQSGEIITINYATPNVNGVTNKCQPDQANIKIAGVWICSRVIEKTIVTREILRREIIHVTNANSFIFNSNKDKSSFNIGDSTFSTIQNFGCVFPESVDVLRPPNPSTDCYTSTISYEGKTYELNDNQLINLDSNIAVQYFAGGEITRTENKLAGTYIFNVVNPLDIDIGGGLSFKQNDISKVKIKLTNNLPSNQLILKISQKVVRTNQNLIDKQVNLNANKGDNDYEFDINTENLGVNEIILQAFYPITADANILLPSEKIRINVEILGEQPSIIKFIEVEKEEEKFKEPNFIKQIWNNLIAFFKNLFS